MEKLYGNEEEATWFVVAWNKLYRAGTFETIRYPEGRIHEDEATTIFFDEAKKLVFVDRVLYGYFTENTGSITAIFSRNGCSGWRRRRNGSDSLMSMDIPVSCRLLIENYVMHVLLFISVAQIMWKKQKRLKRN